MIPPGSIVISGKTFQSWLNLYPALIIESEVFSGLKFVRSGTFNRLGNAEIGFVVSTVNFKDHNKYMQIYSYVIAPSGVGWVEHNLLNEVSK